MDPVKLLALQAGLSLCAWSLVAAWLLWPRLRDLPLRTALLPLVLIHCFRHLGLNMLAPGLAAESLPGDWAAAVAIGDFVTVILALSAAVALRLGARGAVSLTWVFNVVGLLDLVHNVVAGVRLEVAHHLAAAWFVPAFVVPAMFVVHLLIFALLVRALRRGRGR